MERLVSVLRDKRDGSFVVNPLGTFKGYGAYVGIGPYRDCPDADPSRLGELVADLLDHSGPTGFPIQDIDAYREQSLDGESERVRQGRTPKRATTAAMASRYHRAQVSRKDGPQSWKVIVYRYDPKQRLDVADGEHRIRLKEGSTALAEMLMALLE